MDKKFFHLSFVLLAIIIFESAYIFNLSSNKKDSPVQKEEETSEAAGKFPPSKYEFGDLNTGYLDYLGRLTSGTLASASAIVVCSGTIQEIYAHPWNDHTINEYRYEKGFKLKDSSPDCVFLYFDKFTSQFLKLYKLVSNNGKQEISFDDIRIGDKIIYRSEINLLKPKSNEDVAGLIKATIIKL